jgi:hypothetical protein
MVSTIKFDIWKQIKEGGLYEYPKKIYQWRQRSCPLGILIKGIVRAFNWFKCLGGFLHVKPTAGCQISTLIFEKKIMEGDLYEYPIKNISRRRSSCPLGISFKDIVPAFNWRKCLGWFMHLKPTVGCQISTLIFEFSFVEGGLYAYSMNNISRTAKFLPTWDFIQG